MSTPRESLVTALVAARRSGRLMTKFPSAVPLDPDSAYDLQTGLNAALGRTAIGWKIGCTNPWAQQLTGTDEPFFGRMHEETTFTSPADLSGVALASPIVEPEIAFRIDTDLTPDDAPFTLPQVLEATAALAPAIEVVDCRFEGGWSPTLSETIVDNGVHGCFVAGSWHADWTGINRPKLRVAVTVNGEPVTDGVGSNALDDPASALVWLANRVTGRGGTLRAGDVVTTGNIANAAVHAKPGDHAVCDFGPLGRVEATFH